jgi:16S rRNA (cytidine1402-2'-O)-methyltransferase
VSIEPGVLYVVATPIGNMADMSRRALETLSSVTLIAAEDTRHTAVLLRHYGVHTPMFALHEHNERRAVPSLLARLREGGSVALVSDAGTPLVSDPGGHLVAEARAAGLPIVPVPGPSALLAALSVAGFPADRFVFEGFLPPGTGPRRARIQALAGEPRTIVFYEAPHRVQETLTDLAELLGGDRQALIARELTKVFEETHRASLTEIQGWLVARPERGRGEFVIVVEGRPPARSDQLDAEDDRLLAALLEELPAAAAARLAARLTGKRRRALYARAVELAARARPQRPGRDG